MWRVDVAGLYNNKSHAQVQWDRHSVADVTRKQGVLEETRAVTQVSVGVHACVRVCMHVCMHMHACMYACVASYTHARHRRGDARSHAGA